MTENTAPATETSKESALTKLVKASKDLKVNATDKKATGAEFKKTMGKRAELLKALADFDKASDGLAVKMVQCFGTAHVVVEGVTYVPTSRGERVYYKKMGSTDAVEL